MNPHFYTLTETKWLRLYNLIKDEETNLNHDFFYREVIGLCGFCFETTDGEENSPDCSKCGLYKTHCSNSCSDAPNAVFWRLREAITFYNDREMALELTEEMLRKIRTFKPKEVGEDIAKPTEV